MSPACFLIKKPMKKLKSPRKQSLRWLAARLKRLLRIEAPTERQAERIRWLTVAVANAMAREKVKSNAKARRLK